MIAASDPQEFVPSGRQQALRHPGPLETPVKKNPLELDDLILSKLQKVSLIDKCNNEWWILRKATLNTHFKSETCNIDKIETNKSYSHQSSYKSRYSDFINETSSLHSNWEQSFDRFGKRLSEASTSKFINRRLSVDSDSKSDSKTSDTNKFQYNKVPIAENTVFHGKPNPTHLEDELYVQGNTVIWSRGVVNNSDDLDNGRKTVCCYTSSSPIKQALWCTFYCERPVFEENLLDQVKTDEPCGIPVEAVCVADSYGIRVYTPKGENYSVAVPFGISKLWNIKFGMLIEKENGGFPKESLYETRGTLFSLSYPLDDVCPVVINQSGSLTIVNNTNLKVVFTNENPSICMIYDTNSKQHSVYRIRKVKPDEKDCGDKISTGFFSNSQSNKLKSRLSMWENVVNTRNQPTPSPVSKGSNLGPAHARSQSSMAVVSRCQSPAVSSYGSPWPTANSKLNVMMNSDLSKSYFDYSKTVSYLRSTPAICLDYLWTDNYSVQEPNSAAPASKVFFIDDLVGQRYLCYILTSRSQLSIVKVDFSGPNIVFGMLTSMSAKDAVPIPQLHMLAILEHSGNVSLYSGLMIVGKLHIGGTLAQHTPSPCIRRRTPQFTYSPYPRRSSLLPHLKSTDPKFDEHLISPVLPNFASRNPVLQMTFPEVDNQKVLLNGLMDAIENRMTLKYSDGTFYRITLPSLASTSLVESCLTTLRQILQKDVAIILLCKWYSTRNVIGSKDITPEQEWSTFTGLLFELFGYDDDQHSTDMSKEIPITPSCSIKRQRYSTGTNEDWNYLSNSRHGLIKANLDKTLRLGLESNTTCNEDKPNGHIDVRGVLFPYIRQIHLGLHLLYEDIKLNTLKSDQLPPLMKLLNRLSVDLNLEEYNIHYWHDFPDYAILNKSSVIPQSELKNVHQWPGVWDKPVSIWRYVYDLLDGICPQPYPYLTNVNTRSRNIVQLCGILSEINKSVPSEICLETFAKEISGVFPQEHHTPHKATLIDNSALEQVVLFMVDMKITTSYLDTLPYSIYYLFYDALWKCRENPPSGWPPEAYYLLWREDLAAEALKLEKEKQESSQELLGMYSSTQLDDEDIIPGTKADFEQVDGMEDINNSLMKLRFSEDIRVNEARKMLQSSKPVPIVLTQRPDVSDHDFIEEQEKHLYGICIRTMALPVGRGMFTLRTATPVITEPLSPPPLCLTGRAPPRGTSIDLNHIDTPSNMNLWPLFHNGVANGLRITPDAHNIDNTWIIFNKAKGNEPQMEHAGFLLALGLNGHLKNLEFNSLFNYLEKVHEMTSVGILLGLSAAFRGTCHTGLTKILAIHVEALLPPTSMELDIPQTPQVAGLLGVGLVYQGTAHRHMTEILLSEIGRPPGPEMENSIDRESYSLAAGLSLGLVTLRHGGHPAGLSDLNVPDSLHYYMVGGNKRSLTGSQKDKYKTPSFQIREGSSVNLDITAPGATLALGLMYLGTGNKAVADWMAPPETQYLLDFVRPDFLLLRVLSRSLILWADVEPSKEWVEGQVPPTIIPHCMVKPCHYLDVDYEAMNQAYCNIVAGACFALGLKFAGTADEDAFETLLHFCHMFTSLTSKSIAELAGKSTIETCLTIVLLSTAMVMAGTGNLEIIRLVRHLRRRVGVPNSSVVTYGSHLATHMALGLLFLGGGRYTLSNSPASVAALICAFYPKFPTHSNDNRYHLQAFRHLYVLAVEPRLIIPKEVHLDENCYANLRVVKLNGKAMNIKGPGIIPDLNTLIKVEVDDDRYWPVSFERGRNWELLEKILSTTGYIEVKQRAGCLSYLVDKFGYRSQLARTLTHSKVVPWDPSPTSITMFTSDKSIKLFCKHFLAGDNIELSPAEGRLKQALLKVTYDAVVKDKLIVIVVFIAMFRLVSELQESPNPQAIWQFKIITKQVFSNLKGFSNLISKEVILSLHQGIVGVFDSWETSLKPVLQNFLLGKDFTHSLGSLDVKKLASYTTFYNFPWKSGMYEGEFFEVFLNLQNQGLCTKTIEKILKIFDIR
ncbi:anaphase promoting complex subunit 1 isoform X2 [Leptinotarsa decemlineata]|uniref:anaphase promoting complex subunit 1 isoform X2 n=1 Tax=Leptinotarsa decemlineata TaxID=7539 RepID=UPI003D30AC1D